MEKNKKLTKANADELSDKKLENVSGGTEITDNESIIINNNIFDTSIKFDNFNFGANINFNNSDTDTKQNIINKNITSSNNSDIIIF